MREGQPFDPRASMRLLTAAEHILIGSTHVEGSNLEAIQAKFDSPDTGERRAARQLARIPLQVVDEMNAIPDEEYEEVNNGRRDRFLEGGIAVIAPLISEDGNFVSSRLWLTEMTDRRTGMTPNTWQVQAIEELDENNSMLAPQELDKLTITGRSHSQNNFVLHPRKPEEDFRVLEMLMS